RALDTRRSPTLGNGPRVLESAKRRARAKAQRARLRVRTCEEEPSDACAKLIGRRDDCEALSVIRAFVCASVPDRFNCGAFYVCDLLRDALSQIRPGRAAGIHLSFVFRNARSERMDVPTKLRLALSRYLEPSLAARQSLPSLAAGLWDCLCSNVNAAVCQLFAPEFGNRFAARSACNQRSFCSGRYRAALHVLCCATTPARRIGNSAAA